MTSVSANDVTKTYFCKTAGCENEARSPVGRYAYCDEHQGTAARDKLARSPTRESGGGAEQALRELLSLAKQVDRAKAKAEAVQRAANEANRKADSLAAEYAEALAAAARGGMRIAA